MIAELKRIVLAEDNANDVELTMSALRENNAFVHLARKAGFHVDEAEGATQHWTLPLTVDDGVTAP